MSLFRQAILPIAAALTLSNCETSLPPQPSGQNHRLMPRNQAKPIPQQNLRGNCVGPYELPFNLRVNKITSEHIRENPSSRSLSIGAVVSNESARGQFNLNVTESWQRMSGSARFTSSTPQQPGLLSFVEIMNSNSHTRTVRFRWPDNTVTSETFAAGLPFPIRSESYWRSPPRR